MSGVPVDRRRRRYPTDDALTIADHGLTVAPCPVAIRSEPDDAPSDTPGRATTAERLAWQVHGACKGLNPDLFFPARGESLDPARDVCNACAVKAECLAWALDNGEKWGVWGGTSERERRVLRIKRPRQFRTG